MDIFIESSKSFYYCLCLLSLDLLSLDSSSWSLILFYLLTSSLYLWVSSSASLFSLSNLTKSCLSVSSRFVDSFFSSSTAFYIFISNSFANLIFSYSPCSTSSSIFFWSASFSFMTSLISLQKKGSLLQVKSMILSRASSYFYCSISSISSSSASKTALSMNANWSSVRSQSNLFLNSSCIFSMRLSSSKLLPFFLFEICFLS